MNEYDVRKAFEEMEGGEIFVPKIPSISMEDFAKIIAPDCKIEYIGIRPGEKMHEVMIPTDDARHTIEYEDHYRIMPEFVNWTNESKICKKGTKLPERHIPFHFPSCAPSRQAGAGCCKRQPGSAA